MRASAPPREDLDPSALMAEAVAAEGLEDWGEEPFHEPFVRLLTALREEPDFTPHGRLAVKLGILKSLGNRLRLARDLREHPEILEEDVSDPIVIVGLGRTGSSKLQRMISRDPAVERLVLWKLLNPAPLTGWRRGAPDGRIALAEAHAAALAQNPDLLALHPMAPQETDEDLFLMEMYFEGLLPVVSYHLPHFYRWWRDRPRFDFYAFEKILLQYLQWQDGGRNGRPWVMKAQTHLGGTTALFATFPNATLVHCHRDVPTAMASSMRTAEAMMRLVENEFDLADHGRYILEIYADEMAKCLAQRDRLGPGARIVDVAYTDIVTDPIAVIARVYDVHGLVLTEAAEQAMRSWSGENPQYRFGKVPYSLERYGMDARQVLDAFGDYPMRFAQWAR
jgi:Sulfotransferase family